MFYVASFAMHKKFNQHAVAYFLPHDEGDGPAH